MLSFWSKINFDGPVPEYAPELGPCWLWTRARSEGYGKFRHNGIATSAHRLSYSLLVGPIPVGLELDHLCRVRHCVKPTHLEAVTRRENLRRGVNMTFQLNAAKTHCAQGHAFTEPNTYAYRGHRQCRACRDVRLRAFKARQKAAAA